MVHYGDEEHHLNGEARNIKATVQPETPVADNQFPTNLVTFALSNSTFTYDGRPVENINVQARGRVNDSRADIDELVLQSPVMEAHLQGSMDDWSILRYHMQATATVDLTQISDVLQSGTTLRGAGNFTGNVTGEGSRYNVQGNLTSDALAADGIRVKALNLTAQGSGDSKTYDLQGKVLADLLTAGGQLLQPADVDLQQTIAAHQRGERTARRGCDAHRQHRVEQYARTGDARRIERKHQIDERAGEGDDGNPDANDNVARQAVERGAHVRLCDGLGESPHGR